MIGAHWTKVWSKTSRLVALSSLEFEPCAFANTSAEAIGLQPSARGFDMGLQFGMLVDTSAALGIFARRGVGKARHLDTNHFWFRDVFAKTRVSYQKAAGTSNPSDMVTTGLLALGIDRHV